MFLISSCNSEFLCVLSWQNVSWSYLCSGVTTPWAQRPVWADLYGPPSMAAAPATLPVWSSRTERMDPWEQREDTLPHRGLEMNGWGSPDALQASMHHAWFTDKYVPQPHHWEFQGIPALFCLGLHWFPTLTRANSKTEKNRIGSSGSRSHCLTSYLGTF